MTLKVKKIWMESKVSKQARLKKQARKSKRTTRVSAAKATEGLRLKLFYQIGAKTRMKEEKNLREKTKNQMTNRKKKTILRKIGEEDRSPSEPRTKRMSMSLKGKTGT